MRLRDYSANIAKVENKVLKAIPVLALDAAGIGVGGAVGAVVGGALGDKKGGIVGGCIAGAVVGGCVAGPPGALGGGCIGFAEGNYLGSPGGCAFRCRLRSILHGFRYLFSSESKKQEMRDQEIRLFVQLKGENIELKVQNDLKVRDLKDEIYMKNSILSNRQRLYFNGRLLMDDERLTDCEIGDTSVLELDIGINISVKTPNRRTIKLTIWSSTSLMEIKNLIKNQSGYLSENQRLFFNNQELYGNNPMYSYEINNKDTLRLEIRRN